MLPILKMLSDKKEHSISEYVGIIETKFNLTDKEKAARLGGGQRIVYNRVSWGVSYLKRYGLIIIPRRGYSLITEKGIELLNSSPDKITIRMLRNISENTSEAEMETEDFPKPPDEVIGVLINDLNEQLASDILDLIYTNSPFFFEKLVIDLLLKMGYGGIESTGLTTAQTGDGGIDGVIKQDVLGLDSIYIQAKRWERDRAVGRPDIQKFVGALAGKNASKGVFITTSKYSESAVNYAENLPNNKVILIDGMELTKLMIKYDLAVSVSDTYHIKKIDSDYFENI